MIIEQEIIIAIIIKVLIIIIMKIKTKMKNDFIDIIIKSSSVLT